MIKVSIAYHSGFGHTEKVAKAIAEGAKQGGAKVSLIKVTEISQKDWKTLDNSDAIIFGSPTYMGGVSAEFKKFIDSSSKQYVEQRWKNKIAGGFTNAGAYSGDKLSALIQLVISAAQHSMIWVGQAEMYASGKGVDGPKPTDINRMGSWLGLMTQANNNSPEITPPIGDIKTAVIFGKRIAEITKKLK